MANQPSTLHDWNSVLLAGFGEQGIYDYDELIGEALTHAFVMSTDPIGASPFYDREEVWYSNPPVSEDEMRRSFDRFIKVFRTNAPDVSINEKKLENHLFN